MAEDKKSFLLYTDLIHTVNKMPNDKAGELFKHILSYVNDLNPETEDLIIQLTFEPIKQQLKRDLLKYKESIIDKSNAGKLGNLKRWHKDLYDKVINNQLELDNALNIAENRKVSHTDNMQSQPIAKIAVNDNVNVNVINNIKDINTFDFKKSCISLGIQEDIINDWLIVRKGKKASNTQTAFNLIKSELSKTTLPANECIKIAVQNSWSGFKADWLKTLDIPINKISNEDEYMLNVMKQVNQIRNDIK